MLHVGEHLARKIDLTDRPVEFFGIDQFRTGIEPHMRAVGQHDLAPFAHSGVNLHPLPRSVGLMPVMKGQGDGRDDGRVFDYSERPPPPPGPIFAGGGIQSGTDGYDRIQPAAYALLSFRIVFDLNGIQQIAEQLVQRRIVQSFPQPHAYLLRLFRGTRVLHVGEQLFAR